MLVGRYAPSPTGALHLGNLRTALVAHRLARRSGGRFLLRWEDLDDATASPHWEAAQAEDLRALGIDWDGEPLRQSERLERYHDAIDRLVADDRTYPCYCSRREIREAAAAPNGHEGYHYPGTCRDLDAAGRAAREAAGRPPALRLRAGAPTVAFDDLVHGPTSFVVDDFVLRRNDGTPAYHVAVVVDDAESGVTQVVRGDDLLPSAARQLVLHELLGLTPPDSYAHVPLVLAPSGKRLAKRDGAVTLADQLARGRTVDEVRDWLWASLGPDGPDGPLPTEPWTLPADVLDEID